MHNITHNKHRNGVTGDVSMVVFNSGKWSCGFLTYSGERSAWPRVVVALRPAKSATDERSSPMNISQVVPLWKQVSPKLYGGTAQLVSSLNGLHRNPGGELAFLGRIAPEKRPDHAIEIAKGVRISLQISAKPIDWLSLPDPNPTPDPPLPPDPSPFPGPPFPEPVPPRPPNPSPVPGPPITIREATRSCPLSKRPARKMGVTMMINTGQRVPL